MFWKNDSPNLRLAASLLSADFGHLADEIQHVTDAGIETAIRNAELGMIITADAIPHF